MQARQHRKLLPMSLSSSSAVVTGGARPLGVGTAGLLDCNSEELVMGVGEARGAYIWRAKWKWTWGFCHAAISKVIAILLAPGIE